MCFLRSSLFLTLSLLLCVLGAASAQAGLKVYYLRHAESGHNVKDSFANIPKEQWPPYVGNADMFSPKGEQQVEAVTKALKVRTYDFIAVSPLWRTRHTILPYLKENKLKAEIWPELAEITAASYEKLGSANLPTPSPNLFGGAEIVIPADETPYFTLRPGSTHLFEPKGKGKQKAADVAAELQQLIDRVKKQWGGTDKTILLVGHGTNGRALLHAFIPSLRGDPRIQTPNTSLWMIEEQPDGSFSVKIVASEPFEAKALKEGKTMEPSVPGSGSPLPSPVPASKPDAAKSDSDTDS